MALAIAQARLAEECGEIPVGAVVVKDGQVVGAGHNRTLADCDPTAHAEVVALRAASRALGNHRLSDCSLYVTLEPCAMCIGGILHSRLEHVYFGAYDPKAGACGSVVNLPAITQINHHCSVQGGVSESVCSEQLSAFFQKRRLERRRDRRTLREDALRLPQGYLNAWMQQCVPLQWDHLQSAGGLRLCGWENPNASSHARALVLCLHGAATWSYLYRDLLLSEIPDGLKVWAIDLPGHGASDKTKHGNELNTRFQLLVLEELLSSSDFDSVHILAHGTGCALAETLANKYRCVVHGLTLCNPISCTAPTKPPRSLKQLHAWMDTLSTGRGEFTNAICAPYPDAGHVRGLLNMWQRPSDNNADAGNLPCALSKHYVGSVHHNADYFLGLPQAVGRLIDLKAVNGC